MRLAWILEGRRLPGDWVIAYGNRQDIAPSFTGRLSAKTPCRTALTWAALAVVPAGIAVGLILLDSSGRLIGGLLVFLRAVAALLSTANYRHYAQEDCVSLDSFFLLHGSKCIGRLTALCCPAVSRFGNYSLLLWVSFVLCLGSAHRKSGYPDMRHLLKCPVERLPKR